MSATPCDGNANVCAAEGCFGRACIKVAEKCGHPLGSYDLTCAAPAGHDGGHVGPFYVRPNP